MACLSLCVFVGVRGWVVFCKGSLKQKTYFRATFGKGRTASDFKQCTGECEDVKKRDEKDKKRSRPRQSSSTYTYMDVIRHAREHAR